jgi:hypothetical protein
VILVFEGSDLAAAIIVAIRITLCTMLEPGRTTDSYRHSLENDHVY